MRNRTRRTINIKYILIIKSTNVRLTIMYGTLLCARGGLVVVHFLYYVHNLLFSCIGMSSGPTKSDRRIIFRSQRLTRRRVVYGWTVNGLG